MREMSDVVKKLTVDTITAENEKALPQLTRSLRRMVEVPGVAEVIKESEEAHLKDVETPIRQMAHVGGGK
jgi:hypothetical protein